MIAGIQYNITKKLESLVGRENTANTINIIVQPSLDFGLLVFINYLARIESRWRRKSNLVPNS